MKVSNRLHFLKQPFCSLSSIFRLLVFGELPVLVGNKKFYAFIDYDRSRNKIIFHEYFLLYPSLFSTLFSLIVFLFRSFKMDMPFSTYHFQTPLAGRQCWATIQVSHLFNYNLISSRHNGIPWVLDLAQWCLLSILKFYMGLFLRGEGLTKSFILYTGAFI